MSAQPIQRLFTFAFIGALSIYVLYEQMTSSIGVGMEVQVQRHLDMMAGESEFYNPWQYRIFSSLVLQGIIDTVGKIGIHPHLSYALLRIFQCFLIFYLSLKFFKQLGIQNHFLKLLGLVILAFNFSNANFQADLAFNTYFDIAFYLAAAVLILDQKHFWIIPLAALASLNRETSGFIPVMLALSAFNLGSFRITNKTSVIYAALALAAYIAVFVGVRMYFGDKGYAGIHEMEGPLDFLKYNLSFFTLYPQMLGTWSIIPIMALLGYGLWPDFLKRNFWLIVPVWIIIHFLKSYTVETRLFLVPQTLIFIPAILAVIEQQIKGRSID